MGVADSLRWIFAIRQRDAINATSAVYQVIRNNYDPATLQATPYVNGNLWTYQIFEDFVNQIADAVELRPPGLENEPVNFPVSSLSSFALISGYYHTGLTRDDVGALRFLHRPRNIAVEPVLTGSLPGPAGWTPFLGTNVVLTNAVGGTNGIALRFGVDKVRFRKVQFDSVLGQGFTTFTNTYREKVIATNGEVRTQFVRRPVAQPDIIFTVADLAAAIATRTTASAWTNADTLNGTSVLGGPGIITPGITITFNHQRPFLINQSPFFVTEPSITDTNARFFGLFGGAWASFDGSTNAPIIYPEYLHYTLDQIRNAARGGGPP
jgi:hypothetical protein